MWRLIILSLTCLVCFSANGSALATSYPPWVSCFGDTQSGEWKGPKTVRTPVVTSAGGQLRAYAVIEAKAGGPGRCLNTVRLFIATSKSQSFKQVYLNKGSSFGGTANSLLSISWSADGRWLLVAFENYFYASDAGGVSVLLYDRKRQQAISPDIGLLVKTALKKDCSIWIGMPFSFDTLSRVHLRLADHVDEGDEEPNTHCFNGQGEWIFNPERGTVQSILSTTSQYPHR